MENSKIYTPITLRLYNAWVLYFSNRYVWNCSTGEILLPFFKEQMRTGGGRTHLDVGVGSGYYLKRAVPVDVAVTMLDINRSSLEYSATQLPDHAVEQIVADVTQPLDALRGKKFDSISIFYLLHCLSGRLQSKQQMFHHLRDVLSTDGRIFGATILGDEVGHNLVGRFLMRFYNKNGVFSNRFDTRSDLEYYLHLYFHHVSVLRVGRVAIFEARSPRMNGL